MPTPIPFKAISTIFGVQSIQSLSTQAWGADFFLPQGFVATFELNKVALDWLAYADDIFLYDQPLSEIIAEERAVNLGVMMTEFIGVEDVAVRTIRQNAWNAFVKTLLGPASAKPDGEKCRLILAKLANDNYAEKYNLELYKIASNTVVNEEINSALTVMNVSLKQAFNFLTLRDVASLTPALASILYKRLLAPIPSEQAKKALVEALLRHAYFKGMFEVLPAMLKEQSELAIAIQLTRHNDNIICTERTLFHRIVPANHDEEKNDAAELILNECVMSLTVAHDGKVIIAVDAAVSYSKSQPAIDLISTRWRQQLNDLRNYARNYIVLQRHDEQLLNTLFRKYPGLSTHDNTPGCFAFFQYRETAQVKAQRLFTYLGKNDFEFITQLIDKLDYYAAKGEDQYVYALKVLCGMGQTAKAASALAIYTVNQNDCLRSDQQVTEEQYVRKAYQYMRGHGVYLVYDLLPEMAFINATVLCQHPPRLLQFDHAGNMRQIANELPLAHSLPLCNKTYLTVYRFEGEVDYIKPLLDQMQVDELNHIINHYDGINITLKPDYFNYPDMAGEVNPSIVKLYAAQVEQDYGKYPRRFTSL